MIERWIPKIKQEVGALNTGLTLRMWTDPEGYYVLYSDHKAALAEKEKELAELLEKVRRWDTANEKIKMMVKKDYYVDDMQTAKDELFKAENALRAAVEKKLANISKCPDCGREKAKDAVESAMGFCPKWWAIYDHDAHEDCRRSAVGQ